jgi:hypothetical protein
MNLCKHVAWMALWAGATACSPEPWNELDPGTVDSPAKAPRPPRSPKDAAPVDTPPPVDPPLPGDGGGDAASFIDACLLPGMTQATFNPTGTLDARDEGVTAALNLPFQITLSGTPHNKFWITTNGQLGFGATPGGSAFGQATCPLPDARFTAPILLAYSVDLVGRIDPGAGVCYATTGTSPHRKLVVTWKDSFFYESWLNSNVTFSATLNESTNIIDVVLARVDAPYLPPYETGLAAALGIQSGGSASVFSCFQEHAPEGTVVHYSL